MRRRKFLGLFNILLSIFLLRSTVSPASEKEILLEFKGNISSDPFNSLKTWDRGSSPCGHFKGIVCDFNGKVQMIILKSASLAGALSSSLSGLKSLAILSLSGNRFTGNIPAEFAEIGNLRKLNLSGNALYGQIPEFLGDLRSMRLLDLSKNYFSGEIPQSLFKNCSRTKFVSLSHNNLSGPIPNSFANCYHLEGFDFSFNKLDGSFPAESCVPSKMNYISVGNNFLAGNIPEQINGCRSLQILDIGSNAFTGSFPFEILQLKNLSSLNASSNHFKGEILGISTCSERMEALDISRNNLHGEIAAILANCSSLLEMNLSGNNLQGEIPQELSKMTNLRILDLHQNQLNGSIPATLGKLHKIQFFDVSQNLLSGIIPSSLGNLSQVVHFNVSFNNLSGVIPASHTIQQFGASAFTHNPGLCGAPLDTTCPENGPVSSSSESRRTKVLTVSTIIAIIAASTILTGVCVITIINMKARKMKLKEVLADLQSTPVVSSDSSLIIGKLVLFSKSLPSKYEDWETGTKALLDKDCLIGGGSIGTVYKTSFQCGISIAVKKLESLGRIRNQDDFEQEIGRLGNLQHPNLLAYQGYYWSPTLQLIISEYVPNGNLYEHLHGFGFSSTNNSGERSKLHWSRRFGIALGTARALAYLHHDCKPQVLHMNVKSTNILLDDDYEARLSDYGLVKLLPILNNYPIPKFHRAAGYIAPELACQSLRFSDRCDVFSFGVILLELVTGRKPVERSPTETDVVVLCDHVRVLLERGAASDCFDQTLRGFAENELIQVLKLGLICTSEAPLRRPSMSEAVQVLESIKPVSGS